MATITVGGQKLWVDDAFNDLSPQAQADATAEIASRLQVAGPASAPFGFAPPPPPQGAGAGAPDGFAQRFQPALDQPLAIFNPPMPRPRPAEAKGAAAPQIGAPDPQSAQSAGAPDSFALPPADPRLPWWATGAAARPPGGIHSLPGHLVMPAQTDYVTAQVESSGKPYAKADTSSASGVGQFLDGRWLELIDRYRPDLKDRRTRQQVLDLRFDPDLSLEMLRRSREENEAELRKAGIAITPGTAYLEHVAGQTGARRVLSADPSTPASAVLRPQAMASNRQFANKTAGDVIAWADRRMAEEAAARAAPFDHPSQTNRRRFPQVTPFGWGLPNWLPPH